ncbi:MAG TPA: M13 family metallopeptidase [Usitatibacter sp.]|nr:M13 family metallopeptidase [Usitatibacter sp.]
MRSILLAGVLALHAGIASAALDIAGMDPGAAPCEDFYAYANGKWMEATEIPKDRTVWGTFAIVEENNEKVLKAALDEALRNRPPAGSAKRKAVDFFASGLDTAAIEKAGMKPLEPLMKQIEAMQGVDDLSRMLGRLHADGLHGAFSLGVRQDAMDSTRYIVEMGQGGLGLPDRDYYFAEDARSRQHREAYVKHVAKMLELYGLPAGEAAKQAKTIFEFESELAKASRKRADLRDPHKNYNKLTLDALAGAAPQFAWPEYFRELNAPKFSDVNVRQPEFVKRVAELAAQRPMADWRAYLRWHVLRDTASKLPEAFANEAFDFEERILLGKQAQPPRFRQVLEVTAGRRGSEPMGQALGQLFVERAFPPEAKARALELVADVKAALADRLRSLDWMEEQTRARALEKLSTMGVKMGYPDQWRDYSDADVGPYPFVENFMRAKAFEMRRQLRRIGGPVDRGDWWMGPHAVNAYFDGSKNEIAFPAGILQPPFFDAKADDAVNYGAIGMVIGHEITHGFDDRGRKFDAKGNLRDWWTPADAKRYEERAEKIVKQYAAFDGPEGLKVNGRLTLGENISDLGGLKIAYLALQKALQKRPQGPIDGLTPEQRFFLSHAQAWRLNMRPEQERVHILTDGHSPARYRVKGPIAHMPEFARAFSCDPKKSLLAEGERAEIW